MTGRRLLAAAAVSVGVPLAAGCPAWAHSPTDFLKVPVGRQSTVLLPPLRSLPGTMQIAISSPPGYDLSSVSAGPGWQSQVTAHAAVLDGRGAAGDAVLVTLTGTATRAGGLPVDVRIGSSAAPTESYRWRLTALAGYARPVAADVGVSRPDAPVAESMSSSPRLWPVSLACVIAAVAFLVVRRPRRET